MYLYNTFYNIKMMLKTGVLLFNVNADNLLWCNRNKTRLDVLIGI